MSIRRGSDRPGRTFAGTCRYCNSVKNIPAQDPGSPRRPGAALALYLWPDTANTARAFVSHRHNNDVTVASGLPPDIEIAARRTLEMTGIDRVPGKNPPPTDKDKRPRKRREAWDVAEIERQELSGHDTPEQRARVGRVAAATGFWSVWRAVFAQDQGMLQILDQAFRGTASDCFDAKTRQPVPRPGGRL